MPHGNDAAVGTKSGLSCDFEPSLRFEADGSPDGACFRNAGDGGNACYLMWGYSVYGTKNFAEIDISVWDEHGRQVTVEVLECIQAG